jgi:SAM-dependent methyltransferase
MDRYDREFYQRIREASRRSAHVVVPILMDWVRPQSVVDVGCGSGAWLAVFREHGVPHVLGIDGQWLDLKLLEIPEACFLRRDLEAPIKMKGDFDLVMSLEVAEHLPGETADAFVESLTSLGPVVLFSAAIPQQGGQHHVNEQWPDYWTRRFAVRGYAPLDCLRARIWNDPDVEWYYAQNMLLFVRQEHLRNTPRLSALGEGAQSPLPLVHPGLYSAKLAWFKDWMARLQGLSQDLSKTIPPGETLIMVDDDWVGRMVCAGYRTISFLERDGGRCPPPSDDRSALLEFGRLRAAGARFIVFAWPAFWWLDHYPGLADHLRREFPRILENERAVAFDLRQVRA